MERVKFDRIELAAITHGVANTLRYLLEHHLISEVDVDDMLVRVGLYCAVMWPERREFCIEATTDGVIEATEHCVAMVLKDAEARGGKGH